MKRVRRILAFLLCLSVLGTLSGCRYSAVLEQIIYDMLRGQELDREADFHPERNDPRNEDTSDDLKELAADDDAQRVTDEMPQLPQAADGAAEAEGVETARDPEADAELSAPQGTEDAPAEAPEEGGSTETEDGLTEGTDYEGDAAVTSWKQVVDAYGRQVDIPEDVDQVAAVGELAVMVLMLGGAERLAAADRGLTANSLALRAFPALAGVEPLWGGSGSALSEAGLEALLELAPDVVLETSGAATLSEEQIARLSEQGTAYLVLPEPTSPQQAAAVMAALGTVLGDRSGQGGTDAPQRAADYGAWAGRVGREVSQATASHAASSDSDTGESTNGTYTLYVDGWDENASYRLYSDSYVTLSGYGCAVVNNGATASCQTLASYLGLAHVVNTAAQYGITPKTLYFTPLVSAYRTMEVTGPMASGMVSAGQKLLEQPDGSLGTENFSILLAADRRTAQAIRQSELWAVYPHINSGDGSFHSDGFLDEEGNLVRTQISGAYEIAVNPRGLSSWTAGGAESILESVWAAWRFFGAVPEEEMRGLIREFYSQFYGYSLSDGELDQILEGA